MAINGSALYDQKVAEYSAESSSTRFKSDYLRAVNNTLDRYSLNLNIAHPSHVSSTETTVDFDSNRGYVLEAGIDYWLIKFGHRNGDLTAGGAFQVFNKMLDEAVMDRDHDDSAAATDSEIIAGIPADD